MTAISSIVDDRILARHIGSAIVPRKKIVKVSHCFTSQWWTLPQCTIASKLDNRDVLSITPAEQGRSFSVKEGDLLSTSRWLRHCRKQHVLRLPFRPIIWPLFFYRPVNNIRLCRTDYLYATVYIILFPESRTSTAWYVHMTCILMVTSYCDRGVDDQMSTCPYGLIQLRARKFVCSQM